MTLTLMHVTAALPCCWSVSRHPPVIAHTGSLRHLCCRCGHRCWFADPVLEGWTGSRVSQASAVLVKIWFQWPGLQDGSQRATAGVETCKAFLYHHLRREEDHFTVTWEYYHSRLRFLFLSMTSFLLDQWYILLRIPIILILLLFREIV